MTQKSKLKSSLPGRVLLLLVIVALIALAVYYRDLLLPWVESFTRDLGPWGALLFVLVYAIGTVLFMPGSVMTITGGLLFGLWLGTALSLTGATLGAVLAFLLGRYVGGDYLQTRFSGRTKKIIDGVNQQGWRFVAFVRLVPLFPFNLVNYLFGMTRIPVWQYFLATWLCMLPGAFVYTYFGVAGKQVLRQNYLNALFALGLFAVLTYGIYLIKQKNTMGQEIEKTNRAD